MDTISESEIREKLTEGVARGQFAGLKCAKCGYFGEAMMIVDREETLPNGVTCVYSHTGCPNCDSKPQVSE